MRPEKASWVTDMVEPEMPEAVVLVMDTEPEPCTPAVEAVTMVGGEVETTAWPRVETAPHWLAGAGAGSSSMAMVKYETI